MNNLWEKACEMIPGGVNSPVRAFGSVGGTPLFMDKALGPYIYDNHGNKFIDLVLSYGPMILGHLPREVTDALQNQISKGLSFGAPTEAEVELASLILKCYTKMEMARLVNSGTEATMSAIRVARGFTRRNKIIKFRGCYHGHGDSFLISAGSGALTHGNPSSLGVTLGVAEDTLIADYNHLEEVKTLFEKFGEEIAAVIVEPVAGNMGTVPPVPGFLEGLRSLCDAHNSILIFDEVMTGFRLSKSGATGLFNVDPDMVTLGKIVGGGLPLAAYAGSKKIMGMVSPLGGVYQAGTLSGNPMAVTAGIAQIKSLLEKSPWEALEKAGVTLASEIRNIAKEKGVPLVVNQVGSMFTIFFSERPVADTDTALAADVKRFAPFFHNMLKNGIYLPPSQFETAFLSTAHTSEVLEKIIGAVRDSL